MLLAALGAAAAFAQAASSATFDFAAIANGTAFASTTGGGAGFEGNWNTGDSAGTGPVVGAGASIVVEGIGVLGTALNSGGGAADAFFDATYGGNLGGLGVCSSAGCKTGAGGAVTNDDNAGPIGGIGGTGTESLMLDFSQSVTLTDIVFRRADHALASGLIDINGALFDITGGMLGAGSLAALGFADAFDFKFVPFSDGGTEFYISTATVAPAPIPLPASAALFGAAFAALGLVGRRRKAG